MSSPIREVRELIDRLEEIQRRRGVLDRQLIDVHEESSEVVDRIGSGDASDLERVEMKARIEDVLAAYEDLQAAGEDWYGDLQSLREDLDGRTCSHEAELRSQLDQLEELYEEYLDLPGVVG